MYDIYYDHGNSTDIYECFRGSFSELLEHVSDLIADRCSNIEYYRAE